jgi:hypothetical protein
MGTNHAAHEGLFLAPPSSEAPAPEDPVREVDESEIRRLRHPFAGNAPDDTQSETPPDGERRHRR